MFARPSVRRHIREQWRLIATGQSASSWCRQISRLHRLRLHHLNEVHCLKSCRKSSTTSPLSDVLAVARGLADAEACRAGALGMTVECFRLLLLMGFAVVCFNMLRLINANMGAVASDRRLH